MCFWSERPSKSISKYPNVSPIGIPLMPINPRKISGNKILRKTNSEVDGIKFPILKLPIA